MDKGRAVGDRNWNSFAACNHRREILANNENRREVKRRKQCAARTKKRITKCSVAQWAQRGRGADCRCPGFWS